MPTLLDPAAIRAHIETDLPTDALQRLIDDADADIIAKYGPHTGNITEISEGDGDRLFLTRIPTAIVSVDEVLDDASTTLAANDYRTWYGRVLERISTGTHPSTEWGDRVTVVYTPVDETPRRKRILIDLVRLAIQYDALKNSSAGDYSETEVDYETEREAILGSLAPTLGVA